MLTHDQKTIGGLSLNDNCFRQLIVDIISAVFDGHGAAAAAPGHYGNGLTAVAAEGKQERIQFFIIGFDPGNDIFLTLLCSCQIHISHLTLRCAHPNNYD